MLTIIICCGCLVGAIDTYDYRSDSSNDIKGRILANKKEYLAAASSFSTQDDINLDYDKIQKICIFDFDTLIDYVEKCELDVGVLNSLYNYYAFPICDSNNKYVIGLAENNSFNEIVPLVTEIEKSNNSMYEFVVNPNIIEKVLENNNIISPEFLAMVTLKGSIFNILYVQQNDLEYYIPFTSEYNSKIISGKAYNKDDIKSYLLSLKKEDSLYGGGYEMSTSYNAAIWGALVIVTLIFFVVGAIWIHFSVRKGR